MSAHGNGIDDSRQFYRHFQNTSQDIKDQLDHLDKWGEPLAEQSELAGRCLLAIAQLAEDVRAATAFIPTHDQRNFSESVKGFQERLEKVRKASNPKPRFFFKPSSKVGLKASTSPTALQNHRTRLSELFGEHIQSSPQHAIGRNHASVFRTENTDADTLAISNKTNEFITLSQFVDHCPVTLILSDIKCCVISLVQKRNKNQFPASITLKRILDSAILGGIINGPIHLTGLKNITLSVTCKQFRMHDCESCKIYLHCSSRPIIEECRDISFAPLAGTFSADTHSFGNNMWDQIDDFKWLKMEESPNWKLIAVEDRISDNIWSEFAVENKPRALGSVFDILKLNPTQILKNSGNLTTTKIVEGNYEA